MNKLLILLFALVGLSFVGCAHHTGGKHHHGHHGHHGHKKGHDKMWKKLDGNGDGVITRKEFDSKHSDMFTMMDSNKDGKITKEESMSHHKSMKAKKKSCCN